MAAFLFIVILRNLRSNPLRTLLSMAAIGATFFAFMVITTLAYSWGATSPEMSSKRIIARHALSVLTLFPMRHAEMVRALPVTEELTPWLWFGASLPAKPDESVSVEAVDAKTFLKVYEGQIQLSSEAAQTWMSTRDGMIVGETMAREQNWKVGDTVTLQSGLYPAAEGEGWKFTIVGTFNWGSSKKDANWAYFSYAYVNDALPPARQNLTQGFVIRLRQGVTVAQGAAAVDEAFKTTDISTLTTDERVAERGASGMADSLYKVVNVLAIVLFAIVTLLATNTISLAVREQARRFGILRAIGFPRTTVVALILGESTVLTLLGAMVGFIPAYLVINQVLGPQVEAHLSVLIPTFRVSPALVVLGLVVPLIAGVIAGLPSLAGTLKTGTTDALRAVG